MIFAQSSIWTPQRHACVYNDLNPPQRLTGAQSLTCTYITGVRFKTFLPRMSHACCNSNFRYMCHKHERKKHLMIEEMALRCLQQDKQAQHTLARSTRSHMVYARRAERAANLSTSSFLRFIGCYNLSFCLFDHRLPILVCPCYCRLNITGTPSEIDDLISKTAMTNRPG